MNKFRITAGVATTLGVLAIAVAPAWANKVEEFIPTFANGATEGKLKGRGEEQTWSVGPYKITCEVVKAKGVVKEEPEPRNTLTVEDKFSHCKYPTSPPGINIAILKPITFEYHRQGFAVVKNETTGEEEIETTSGPVTLKPGYFEIRLKNARCNVYLPEQNVPGNSIRKPEGPHGEGYSAANYNELELNPTRAFPERFGLEIENNFKNLKAIFPNEGACGEVKNSEYSNASYIGTYNLEIVHGNLVAPEE